ncbi:cell envelope biogenesis protein TolA [Yersinia vastinensis]|uniref:cell envelope biogenesis protein TolA n=1 Tax=Yersinia vastinensis TaxID=2890318 RepID=UPI001F39F2BB|nr:cell envelope biogenesis protein TolA [Yersinia vastinensis]
MAEEKKELALVTLPVEKIDLEVALLNDKFIDELIDNVRKTAGSVVGDLKTTKGRGVYITMADQVRKSKAAFEVRAKELVAELKARPALIDANRKKFRDEMDKIAVDIRKPVTEYEAEQERLKQEAEAKKKAEELAAEIEVAHEMALLMNDAFDRDAKEKAEEVERLRKAHEEFIAQQAAEKAKREAEEKAKRDIESAEQRERDAKLAQERAEQAVKDAAAKAERDAKELAERVEREKQEAIAAEQRKAQEEADRIKREAQQKEDARLAEEKRVADEAAKRSADVEHRRTINRQAVADLIANGLPEDCAQKCVAAIAKNLISSVRITY